MKWTALAAAGFLAAPATAEVATSTENGFESRHTVELGSSPATAIADFGRIGRWWSPDHTYSGSAANLSLNLVPGGCFCETFPKGGGIEHMRVTYVDPGKRLVLTGSLGPLLYEATAAVMDVRVEPAPGGSRLTLTYRVAGFANGGAVKLAPLVDKVIAEQVSRYRTFANRPRVRR